MTGGLLVAGTTSDAGKSVLTAGICRWLYRLGVKVAPFKAQNMSNNSAVVLGADGRDGEIGRAQAMQAAACGLVPSVHHERAGGEVSQPFALRVGHDRGEADHPGEQRHPASPGRIWCRSPPAWTAA